MVCVQNRTNRTVIHNHMLMHCVTQSTTTTTERERKTESAHMYISMMIYVTRARHTRLTKCSFSEEEEKKEVSQRKRETVSRN